MTNPAASIHPMKTFVNVSLIDFQEFFIVPDEGNPQRRDAVPAGTKGRPEGAPFAETKESHIC